MASWFSAGNPTWEPATLPANRRGPAWVAHDGTLWIFGGEDETTSEQRNVWRYDPTTNAWSSETDLSADVFPYGPAAILDGVAFIIELYNFLEYHLDTGVTVALTLPGDESYGFGFVEHNGLLYYGLSADFPASYDPDTDTWTALTPWPRVGTGYNPGNAVAGDGTHIYVQYDTDFGRYDPATDTWEDLAAPPVAHQVTFGTLSYLASSDTLLLAGGNNGGEVDLLSEYDIATDTWTSLTAMGTARAAHAAVIIDDRLYVAGGMNGGTAIDTMEVWADTPPGEVATADLQVEYDMQPAPAHLEVEYDVQRDPVAYLNVSYDVPSGYNATASLEVQYRTGRTAEDRLLVEYGMIPAHSTHTLIRIGISGS